MPRTTMEVNRQSVAAFLRDGAKNPFVIPEYQRPYAWKEDESTTLFEDLWEFTCSKTKEGTDDSYFLGSIVSFVNEVGEQEIIDGQQRITTLFLLLRAIYTKLEETPENERTAEAKNFINQIEPTIWRTDDLTGKVNYGDILLTSRVINTAGNNILKTILETGRAEEGAKDNYSKNYKCLQTLYEKHSADNPMLIYRFIYTLLNDAILLPITADTQDTALTIFSTLNDRGLPLSDADIFKAKLYNKCESAEAKQEFMDKWKNLSDDADDANESIQSLFLSLMFYYRAKENDTSTTTPGLRKYFSGERNSFKRLYDSSLMDNLSAISDFWSVVNSGQESERTWTKNVKILQALDVLKDFPNAIWKRPVVIYYLCHKDKESFSQNFELFLHKLIAVIITKYMKYSNISALKGDISKLNSAITSRELPDVNFGEESVDILDSYIRCPVNKGLERMLLKILAYSEQDSLIQGKWEIEHIFPQKWRNNYFTDESDEFVKEKIEHIGNKLPFEKKLNIVAGNGYFERKRTEYQRSHITVTNLFGQETEDWDLTAIDRRDNTLSQTMIKIFNSWNKKYLDAVTLQNQQEQGSRGTPEEQALIEDFRRRGLI